MYYLEELNDVQRQAVTCIDGPMLVIAGPGSGKTRVLTYRVAHLIDHGIHPAQILTLTFTNKAAKEMKERITAVVGERAQSIWAGTFHSIFARLLRFEAHHLGYPSNFSIYDTADSKSLLTRIIKDMHLDPNNYQTNKVLARISSAKSNLITPKVYASDQELRAADQFNRRAELYAIYARYVSKCKQAGAMDFDDLLYRLFELLQKNPDNVLTKYQHRFQYLLVDEFQDTNYLQYAIIKKLVQYEGSKQNICVVGDDAQSIYAFRGATIDNILHFQKEFPNLNTFKLEQNYRSTHHIIEAANQVIQKNEKQIQKKIWTDKTESAKIRLIKSTSDSEEGRRIADLIVEYKNRFHVPSNEIAILYRTNAQSRVFEEYLRRYNVPYRVFGGLSFYQRKEIKDLLAYLRLTVNPFDEEALVRVINYPKRGIGQTTLNKYLQFAAEREISLWESLQTFKPNNKSNKSVTGFVKMIKTFIKKVTDLNAHEAATMVANFSGITDLLKSDNSIEGLSRLENVTAILDGIKEFIEEDDLDTTGLIEDKSLATYLQNIALITDQDIPAEEQDYVTLMSVHSAKGLEFDAVFVAGMEEKIFPSFQAKGERDGIDEERRLFYVAITRARKYLTLSFAGSRYRYGKIVYNQPSRFLLEISADLMDVPITPKKTVATGRIRSGVKGNFAPKRTAQSQKVTIPADFKPSKPHEIAAGMRVKHLKFGTGKVLSIDGYNDKKVATIFFKNIHNPQRRIVLRFAKLQIVH